MGEAVLEAMARCGPARILRWAPSDGQAATLPQLIVPETSQCPVPDWAELVLTAEPKGRAIELVAGGTWFYPREAEGLLVVAPQPTATHQVQVVDVAGEVAVFHDAVGWQSDPKRFVPAFVEAKSQAGSKAFWAPGLGTPADYAVWASLGVDLFDGSPLLLAAVRGEALTVDGAVPAAECEAVLGPGDWDVDGLMRFNLEAARAELRRVQHAIRTGALRALAERRCYASPHMVEVLRRFDRQHTFLQSHTPAHAARPVPCMTQEALWMPEVEHFRRRVRDQYTPPASADTLVLLPCSAGKPYRISKSHRYFARALDDSGQRHRVHEVMVTSPLGLVPRELEDTYPANKYDVPVTGHWNRDEEAIIRHQLAALLDAHEYKHVIAHVPTTTWTFIRDLLPDDSLHTGHSHSVQSKADCDRLRDALRALGQRDPRPGDVASYRARKVEDIRGLLSMQFGPTCADALVEGARVFGKVPHMKIIQPGPDGPNGVQLGTTTMDRGLLSLTLEGADIVAAHGVKRVFIEDFWPRKTGSLFAVGVTHADADVREGDDVAVCFPGPDGAEVRACGVAQMPGIEMGAMKRGVAVTLRHMRKQETPGARVAEVAP